MTTRYATLTALVAVLSAAAIANGNLAAQVQSAPLVRPLRLGDVQVYPVQGSVHLIVGAGGNIAVQHGDDGVLVVDTGSAEHGDKVLSAIQSISPKPIRYVFNTHIHPDHTGNNERVSKAGRWYGGVDNDITAAFIISAENVLTRMSGKTMPAGDRPMMVYPPGKRKDIYINDETVQMLHQPDAHTDGDSLIFFRRSDVIVAGDVFLTTTYPFIDEKRGGGINGIIDALNRIIDIANPRENQEGGTMIVPGHGRITDEYEVVEYRDMLTMIRDRIQHDMKRGRTLAQIKAAKPSLDFDGRYGSDTGPWTTDQFIEAIYRGLSARK
jgi:glyoxylase-like metal-dependent hydrolase (beta-lactamase superfamily II)